LDRVMQFQRALAEKGMTAALVASMENIRYLTGHYVWTAHSPTTFVIVPAASSPLLCVPGGDESLAQAHSRVPIESYDPGSLGWKAAVGISARVLAKLGGSTLGLEFGSATLSQHEVLKAALPTWSFADVAPVLAGGTGLFENHSPGGTVARLLDPGTFLGAVRDTSPAARVITTAIAVAALGITFWVLWRPRGDRSGRALEAAAVVSLGPIVASYSWGTHLVLLLLPMLVLTAWAVRRRDWVVLGLVALGWALIGPGHNWFQLLLVSGYPNLALLRLMAEFGVVGITMVWVAALVALSRSSSVPASEPP